MSDIYTLKITRKENLFEIQSTFEWDRAKKREECTKLRIKANSYESKTILDSICLHIPMHTSAQ